MDCEICNVWLSSLRRLVSDKKYLILILILLSSVSIFVGVSNFSIIDIIQGDEKALAILIQSRIPRLIALILAAFGMTISGLIMQQLAQNKFVSPTTATTIDGAKLGILIAMLFFGGTMSGKIIFGFGFSMLTTSLFIFFIAKIKVKNVIFVPLIGMMLGGIIDAITTLIAYQTDQIQNVNTWLQGSMTSILKGNYEMLYVIIPFLILAFVFANRFTIVGLGEDFSKNLGLNYQAILNVGLMIVSVITALVIIIIGSIPFLGLIVPNIMSIYRGDNIKNSLWETALLGAIFLLVCDLIGRIIIFPYEIPISLTVGTIGSALFLYLLFRRDKA